MILEILAVAIVIILIALCVREIFKPQFVICDCGNRCAINPDTTINWECNKCGANGRTPPL